jgi:hypothetical protein
MIASRQPWKRIQVCHNEKKYQGFETFGEDVDRQQQQQQQRRGEEREG